MLSVVIVCYRCYGDDMPWTSTQRQRQLNVHVHVHIHVHVHVHIHVRVHVHVHVCETGFKTKRSQRLQESSDVVLLIFGQGSQPRTSSSAFQCRESVFVFTWP
eukprot:8832832-Lingulodinium_polyedra.AAC.1